MRGGWWTGGFLCIVVAAAMSRIWAGNYDDIQLPRLVVVATHELAANHKLRTEDMSFTLVRARPTPNPVVWPGEAVGACTGIGVKEGEPVSWRQLIPLGTGDNTCANAAVALGVIRRIAQMHTASAKTIEIMARPTTETSSPASEPSLKWLDALTEELPGLSPAVRPGLGEFRGEFIKEFAKRLADNAADKALPKSETRIPRLPASPPQAHDPTEAAEITYFDFDPTSAVSI
jgi:hypothetical protein